jgi:hypothetical protein
VNGLNNISKRMHRINVSSASFHSALLAIPVSVPSWGSDWVPVVRTGIGSGMGSGEGDCVGGVGDGEDGRTWIGSRTGSGIGSWMSSGEVGRVGEVGDVEDVVDEAGTSLGFTVKKPLIPSCDLSFLALSMKLGR